MGAFIDLTGQRFGRLVVRERAGANTSGKSRWRCQCDCGTLTLATTPVLRNGETRSCGCLRRQLAPLSGFKTGSAGGVTHGLSRKHPIEYRTWKHVRARGTGREERVLYADRGVRICSGWDASFPKFLADMGTRPGGQYSIDRRDNDGNYSCGSCAECLANGWPANCRWATPDVQRANQRQRDLITFFGKSQTVTSWAADLGISQSAMSCRLKKWPLARALTRPRKEQRNQRPRLKDHL
jgi:hypothetical protein